MNDEEVGAKYETGHLAGENEAAKVERELVVQLQVHVAFLLLAVVELGEGIESLFVFVCVLVDDARRLVAIIIVAERVLATSATCCRRRRRRGRVVGLEEFYLFVQLQIIRSETIELVGEKERLLLARQILRLQLLDTGSEAFTLTGDDFQ